MDDRQAEDGLEAVEMPVTMQQQVVLPQAERCYQAVHRLPSRGAASAQRPIALRSRSGDGTTTGGEQLNSQQLAFDGGRNRIITDTLLDLTQEMSVAWRRHWITKASFGHGVQPIT